MPSRTITLVVADDHAVVRDGLRRILEAEEDLKVVGEAANGLEAIKLIRQMKPDVVLLDLFMPKASGFDVLRQTKGSDTRFLILTAGGSRADLVEAVRCEAHGIVTKDTPVEILLKAIRRVAAGEYWIERNLLAGAVQQPSNRSGQRFGLSQRELDIVTAICQGATNKEIASRLSISELTVKTHLKSIFEKLGVSSRLELAMFAIRYLPEARLS